MYKIVEINIKFEMCTMDRPYKNISNEINM